MSTATGLSAAWNPVIMINGICVSVIPLKPRVRDCEGARGD